jgi:hypothetical protein
VVVPTRHQVAAVKKSLKTVSQYMLLLHAAAAQMVRVLGISDCLRLRGYPHQRLDGSTSAAARHLAMEAFNRPDSPDCAFLLSTMCWRAGYLSLLMLSSFLTQTGTRRTTCRCAT